MVDHGLEIMKFEAAKTSLLCKRIVKAIKLGESILHSLVLVGQVQPSRGGSLEVIPNWFTIKQNLCISRSRAWGTLKQHAKSWRKVVTNFPIAL